jgi:hypothetical protein
MPRITVHTVKKGENLDKIARSYGIKSFVTIYKDPVNAKFRKTRPDPNKIQPGDKLIIPDYALTPGKRKDLKSLIATVEDRIKTLEKSRKHQIDTTASLKSELKKGQSSFKKTGNAVDGAALVVNILGSLTKITVKSAKIGTMQAAEVAKANKEMIKEVIGLNVSAIEPALQAGAKSMSSSATKAVASLGILGDSFFKMTSPSFWGKTFIKARDEGMFKKIASGKFGDGWDAWSKAVTWDPLKEFDAMMGNIQSQSDRIVKVMDEMIAENRAVLAQLKNIATM